MIYFICVNEKICFIHFKAGVYIYLVNLVNNCSQISENVFPAADMIINRLRCCKTFPSISFVLKGVIINGIESNECDVLSITQPQVHYYFSKSTIE